MIRYFRLVLAVAIAVWPSFVKVRIYRWLFGYRIGRGVRIGLSPFIGVRQCTIGDKVRIGSFNLFTRIGNLSIGDCAQIGQLNVLRGGDRLVIGSYATILRLNVFNAIVEGDFVQPVNSVLELGTGVFVATGHWLDFSDGIQIGDHCVIGGRLSSFWTHNRQRGRTITVGRHTYLGSEIRIAPGADVPPYSIVALGSVLAGRVDRERVLIGGNPARIVRELTKDDLFLVVRKTRNDIPDALVRQDLPADLALQFDRIAEDFIHSGADGPAANKSASDAGDAPAPGYPTGGP